MSAVTTTTFLPESVWRERQAAHEEKIQPWTEPHYQRALRGEKHPVYDFLFSYYSFRPAWLKRWHPGPDMILGGATAQEFLRWSEYSQTDDGVVLRALPENRRAYAIWLRELLVGMQNRPAFFGCFGFHEWAMVYRQTPDQVRHNAWPLRFSSRELAVIVDGSALCCTHHDAFRFFTAPARPLNRLQPERESVPQNEQRGCLHANMDLYKWAFKLSPFCPAELVGDCFALARDIREIDMRASPYDLQALGFAPIRVETAGGRAEYEMHQRDFAARGHPLRDRLVELCERLLVP